MAGRYFFNSTDVYLTFGIVFKKGTSSELLNMPNAWPDETRKMALPIAIVADNEVQFWEKYHALRAFLASGNEFNFLAEYISRRFKVTYESMSSFTMLTNISGGNKVGCAFTLTLVDDYPDVFTLSKTGLFISNMMFDGRNYALGSGAPYSSIFSADSANQIKPSYFINSVIMGKQSTISFDWEVSEGAVLNNNSKFYFRALNGNPNFDAFSETITPTVAVRKGSSVRTWNASPYSAASTIRMEIRADYIGGTITISNLKVELGTRTTDWTPAPEDVPVTFTRIYTSYSLADATSLSNADTAFNTDGQAYANKK